MKNADKPAHPLPLPIDETLPNIGLTKREYFAAMAMQSMIINKGISTWDAARNSEGMATDIADGAVVIADELLKRLES